MGIRQLFIVTAALEVGAGLALLAVPAVLIRLLFGTAADAVPAAGVARVAGVALLSVAAACWWARHDAHGPAARAIVGALLIYNAGLVALVLSGQLGPLGPLQWAAVVLHGTMGIWCARVAAWPI